MDERYWQLALKTDRPVETYTEYLQMKKSSENAEKIEDLPQEQQDWLRAT